MNLSDDIPLHRYTICGRFIHIFIYRQRLLDIPSFTIFHTNITTNEAVKWANDEQNNFNSALRRIVRHMCIPEI